jgi:hypothetical protein
MIGHTFLKTAIIRLSPGNFSDKPFIINVNDYNIYFKLFIYLTKWGSNDLSEE